jgi:hypothetical protein
MKRKTPEQLKKECDTAKRRAFMWDDKDIKYLAECRELKVPISFLVKENVFPGKTEDQIARASQKIRNKVEGWVIK